ncbi:MAG: dTDP-4-dehydrorhamnose reductase [Bacteroidales bacterium]|nr:dTDP-4-dehydrorhamnose reductase [Bacteroidales bacterium]MDD4670289.1 dTDP-4-dehydrorhamnose reductase [Bacteroidales bacterium]
MKTTLVTGANGQLGSELQELTKGKSNFIFTDIIADGPVLKLDICNAGEVENFIAVHKVKRIINCAGYTNVDGAQSNEDLCMKINVEGVVNLAEAAKRHNTVLVHISTDYVFDGNRRYTSYKESSLCRPVSIYGLSKRKSELEVCRIGCRGIVIRTAWLYSPYGKNFVKTMLRIGAKQKEVGVVYDQIGTPTYARDLAKVILRIFPSIKNKYGEIYHYTNGGSCSWYEFASAIMEYASLDCKVTPLTTEQYPSVAPRPACSLLDKSKIKKEFGLYIPGWVEALRECLSRMK